jgi:tetratricopeptide (TPR) repeat protein
MAAKLADLTEAFEFFDRARGLPEQDAQHHLLLGSGYSQLQAITKRGDLRDFHQLALRHFQRALDLDPDVEGAEHGIGVALSRLATHPAGDGDPARPDLGPSLSHFIRELRHHPGHGESHRDAGHIRYAWDEWTEALGHFLRAERAGVAGGAELACIARISIDPQWAGQSVVIDGETLPVCDPARGWSYGSRALSQSPDDPGVLDKLSYVLLSQRRYDEAVGLLERLVTLQPWRTKELTNRIAMFRVGQRNLAAKSAAANATTTESESPDEPPAGAPATDDSDDGSGAAGPGDDGPQDDPDEDAEDDPR